MQLRHEKVWALVFWACMALPLWVGAEEQPPSAEQPAMEQPGADQQANPAAGQAVEAGQTPAPHDDIGPLPTMHPRQADVSNETFATIELDRFIEQEQRLVNNSKKLIKMAAPVTFEAKMKRLPEEKKMEYIYTALEVAGVSPMPKVQHRMFLESREGRILPVYVEENAVKKLNAGLKEDVTARFQGYHVYTYAKGPAILVVDFAATP
ncbi:hypothetical protein [Desulfobulbus elongatus]|uniref:hypothetical protein n=1 Tax=Desulfobulbus elongatus TaxID=53332 RepID=UPI00068511A7|nr:hypothetical protein [Desulfobulbus elongatus]